MGVSEAAEQSASPLRSFPFFLTRYRQLPLTVRHRSVFLSLTHAKLPCMPDHLLDDWLTKTHAAAFLQVSEKTIERLATKGDVRRATRKRPGVRPLPV